MPRANRQPSSRSSTNKTLVALAGLALAAVAHAGDTTIATRTLALRNQPAPGCPGGFFQLFESYAGNTPTVDVGRVGFFASLDGPGVTPATSSGIWVNESGTTRLIARAGDAAPGLSGAVFTGFPFGSVSGPPALLDSGRTAFASALAGTGITFSNDDTVWIESAGTISLFQREGSQAPGLPQGILLSQAQLPRSDAAGNLLFGGTLSGPGVTQDTDQAFWSNKAGPMQLILREGDRAPGTPDGVIFGPGQLGAAYQFAKVEVNDNLAMAFAATLSGPGVAYTSDEGIFTTRGGVLTKVIREGDRAPGMHGGVTFGGNSVSLGIFSLAFNNLGHIAFEVRLGGSIPTTSALFSDHRGTLQPIAVPGDPAPGTNGDFGIIVAPFLSDGGKLAFRATAGTVPSQWPPLGVWWDQNGTMEALALPGQPISNGRTVVSVNSINGYTQEGLIALSAALNHPQIGHQGALLIGDPSGELRVIVATGELFDVSGTGADFRQISEINADINALTQTGEFAFRMAFTDGSSGHFAAWLAPTLPCTADFNNDGDVGTDADIEAFFACLGGACCGSCGSPDFNNDGDTGTDLDIEAFFRVLGGGSC